MMSVGFDGWSAVQQWVFEALLLPPMLWLGLDSQIESGYVGALWLMVGVCQVAVLLVVFMPLERWRPVMPVTPALRRDRWPDVVYTLIHRLGLFRALMFVTLEPWWNEGLGLLRAAGLPTWHADAWWPGVSDTPWVSFLVYLMLFDALAWAVHWMQHRWRWWWALHALHHSQEHMTAWSDNRNHLLDDVLRDSLFVLVGLLVGVAPAQFVAIVALTQLLESLSHANVRLHFGRWGERLLVSPHFHRLHHARDHGGRRGVNYGVLFPWWDRLAGTLDRSASVPPTGLMDQLPQHGGRDYGRGFFSQQWLGLLRLVGRA